MLFFSSLFRIKTCLYFITSQKVKKIFFRKKDRKRFVIFCLSTKKSIEVSRLAKKRRVIVFVRVLEKIYRYSLYLYNLEQKDVLAKATKYFLLAYLT